MTLDSGKGSHANAWNAVATGVNGVSTALETIGRPHKSAFGNVSGITTITLQFSMDGTTFYDGSSITTAGAADFVFNVTSGAAYIRLKSSANVTATASLCANQ